MNTKLLELYTKLQSLTASEAGQDLVEYALLLTMISLALVTAMNSIAQCVTNVFTNISSSLASA